MTCPARPGRSDSRYGGNNRFPIWISNNRVAFQSDREGDLAIFWQSAVGGAAERLTTPEPGTSHVPESWSPKRDRFLFSVKKGSDVSLWTYSLQDKKATPFGDVHSSDPTNAVFSPDGRWVAYASTERNRPTIYVQPFPASGVQHQLPIGASGIAAAAALVSGRKGTVLQPGARPIRVGQRRRLNRRLTSGIRRRCRDRSTPVLAAERRAFDITPDGKFVGLIQAGQTESGAPIAPQIQVVLNWFEELKRLVPATK